MIGAERCDQRDHVHFYRLIKNASYHCVPTSQACACLGLATRANEIAQLDQPDSKSAYVFDNWSQWRSAIGRIGTRRLRSLEVGSGDGLTRAVVFGHLHRDRGV